MNKPINEWFHVQDSIIWNRISTICCPIIMSDIEFSISSDALDASIKENLFDYFKRKRFK